MLVWYNCWAVEPALLLRRSDLAEILPFRGIRYNVEQVNLDDVTSPPYDVISPSELEYFLNRHPKNIVRLILGKEYPTDDETNNRYTRARSWLNEWLADGTLMLESKPCVYAYEQRFEFWGGMRVVRGFTALVKLHPWEDKVILPHEYTLAKPKPHLGSVIRATNANLDSVYGLYPDENAQAASLLAQIYKNVPDAQAHDRQGVKHSIWVVDDQSLIDDLVDLFKDKQIVIADGHHRYETSLAYRDEMRGLAAGDNFNPYDYVMMTFADIDSPGLVMLPTHRMVRGVPEDRIERLIENLSDEFLVFDVSPADLLEQTSKLPNAVGICTKYFSAVVVRKDNPESVESLGVLTLHDKILKDAVGIGGEGLRLEDHVFYTRDADEAIKSVENGECQAAFILQRFELAKMLEVARMGIRLPQKSTYFYPKLLSGMVMRIIE